MPWLRVFLWFGTFTVLFNYILIYQKHTIITKLTAETKNEMIKDRTKRALLMCDVRRLSPCYDEKFIENLDGARIIIRSVFRRIETA